MSDWFRPLPYALDSIAHAVKVSLLGGWFLSFKLHYTPVSTRDTRWPRSLLSTSLFSAYPDV